MSTFIVLGKFSDQGLKGLMTSDADRATIVDKAAGAAGAAVQVGLHAAARAGRGRL